MTPTFDGTSLGWIATERNWQLVHLGCGSTAMLRTPLSILENTPGLRARHQDQARSVGSGFRRRVDAMKHEPDKPRSNIVSSAWKACQMARRLLSPAEQAGL
jgi:hypothetical protein